MTQGAGARSTSGSRGVTGRRSPVSGSRLYGPYPRHLTSCFSLAADSWRSAPPQRLIVTRGARTDTLQHALRSCSRAGDCTLCDRKDCFMVLELIPDHTREVSLFMIVFFTVRDPVPRCNACEALPAKDLPRSLIRETELDSFHTKNEKLFPPIYHSGFKRFQRKMTSELFSLEIF